MTPDQPA
uniref:Uncharacterized protein n=1 Tax=Oryza meridionalis TaxID=40149 RepID=A0A1Y8Z4R2_9ORYZ